MRALNIAATGMMAQQTNVEVISNNLANLSTTGYKRQRAEFEDLLYQSMTRAGAQSSEEGNTIPNGVQLGLGVKTGGIYRVFEQGVLQQTEAPLDVAIKGRGFFVVELPGGAEGYTRSGAFSLNENGQLVTQDGYLVTPNISVSEDVTKVSIGPSGIVEGFSDGTATPTQLGQVQLATFINENGLLSMGDNLYMETVASGTPAVANPGEEGYGTLEQGFLENSNVDAVKEITTLIVAQRAYEMNSKVISTTDEMLRALNQLRA